MKTILVFLFVLFAYISISAKSLDQALSFTKEESLFGYDLEIQLLPGTNVDSPVIICLHGYGGNSSQAQFLRSSGVIDPTLISFNFPNHSLEERNLDIYDSFLGTVDELLPALYIIKKCVLDAGLDQLSLYGFSAGGGAAINILGILNSSVYDKELEKVGIFDPEKKKILAALQKGVILLDCPLKSFDEILSVRGNSPELLFIANRFQQNGLDPIDSIVRLKGLNLAILLFFQDPDEVIYNLQDALFIERLKKANPHGTTKAIIGNEGNHSTFHPSLWRMFKSFQ